ncbi:MAG: hypothetical protein HYS74_00310 [Parcubacteria group bacterium]|nr:hypothetical protein [Parcubacteria group bacterium]
MEIIPAFLERDFSEIERKAACVRGTLRTVQLDVMDGVFAPDTSWPYESGRQNGQERLRSGEAPLPFWEDFDYEIDLMIHNPEDDLAGWAGNGALRLIVHVESTVMLDDIVDLYGARTTREARGGKDGDSLSPVELSLALGIATPNEVLYPYAERIRCIQCMGIEKIGYQGQPLDERVIGKVRDLRQMYPKITISVDGGVSLENAPRLVEAGANRLVVGSAIWKSDDPKKAIEKFKHLRI